MVRVAPVPGPEAGGQTAAVRAVPGEDRSPGVGFHSGQVVSVELVKAVGADEGLFLISGRYFRALYPTGLTQGVTVPMRVVDTGPPLVLKLPDMIAQLMSRLVHPSNTSFSQASSQLFKAMQGGGFSGESTEIAARLKDLLLLPEDPKALAGALEKLFTRNGIFHEALLARGEDPEDVKSLAARLLGQLGDNEKAAPALRSILSHIEAHQARSLIHENPVFPFFLNWGGEEIRGEFELKKGEEAEAGQGGGLLVKLDMPNLGHVEAALWWHAGSVSVALRVGREVEGWLAARLPALSERLKEAGEVKVSTLRVEPREPARPATGRSLLEIRV